MSTLKFQNPMTFSSKVTLPTLLFANVKKLFSPFLNGFWKLIIFLYLFLNIIKINLKIFISINISPQDVLYKYEDFLTFSTDSSLFCSDVSMALVKHVVILEREIVTSFCAEKCN